MAQGAHVFPLTISQEPLPFSPLALVAGQLRIIGVGIANTNSQRAMLSFAAKHGVKPQIEKFPLNAAGVTEAMQKLRDGNMRYRGVLVL